MHFLLDENVAESVRAVLKAHGHVAQSVRDILAPGSPDPLVTAVAQDMGAVLVSHDRDFAALGRRLQISNRKFRRLSRIMLLCSEPKAAGRIEAAMSLIEAEFAISQKSGDKRLILQIGESFIRTER